MALLMSPHCVLSLVCYDSLFFFIYFRSSNLWFTCTYRVSTKAVTYYERIMIESNFDCFNSCFLLLIFKFCKFFLAIETFGCFAIFVYFIRSYVSY